MMSSAAWKLRAILPSRKFTKNYILCLTRPVCAFLGRPLAQTLQSGQQYCECCLVAYRPAVLLCLVRAACSTCPRGRTWSAAASGTSCSIPNLLALSGKKLPRPPKPSKPPCVSALCCHMATQAAALAASLTQHCSYPTVATSGGAAHKAWPWRESVNPSVIEGRSCYLRCKTFEQGSCGSHMFCLFS